MKQVALLAEGHLAVRASIQAVEPQEGGTLRHRRRFAWCQVPEKLIEHQQLSHAAVRLGALAAGADAAEAVAALAELFEQKFFED